MKYSKQWVWQRMQMTAERQARNGEVTNWKGAKDRVNGGMIDVTLTLAEGRASEKHGDSHKPIFTFFPRVPFCLCFSWRPPSSSPPLSLSSSSSVITPPPPLPRLAVSQPPISDTRCANQTQPDITAHCEDEMQRFGSTDEEPP